MVTTENVAFQNAKGRPERCLNTNNDDKSLGVDLILFPLSSIILCSSLVRPMTYLVMGFWPLTVARHRFPLKIHLLANVQFHHHY